TTTVVCSATDSHGNTAQASFTLSLTQPGGPPQNQPRLLMPSDLTWEADNHEGATIPVGFTTPYATNAAGVQVTASCSRDLTLPFPLGPTLVTCSVTDGATITGSFRVTVTDTTAPTLTVPTILSVPATGPNGARVPFVPAPSATDTVDGALAVSCVP